MTTATKAGGAVLKPCPFCGNTDSLLVEHLQGTVLHPAYRVHCDNCGASSNFTSNDHIASWNTRAPAQATIDELRAEVERLTRERWVAIQRELDALKAKQIDVDAVMRLAEKYANSEATEVVTGFCDGRSDAAREALRAFLTKDRT